MIAVPDRLPDPLVVSSVRPGARRRRSWHVVAIVLVLAPFGMAQPALALVAVAGVGATAVVRQARQRRGRRVDGALELRHLPTVVVLARLAVAAGRSPRGVPATLAPLVEPVAAERWRVLAGAIANGASFDRAIDAAFDGADDDLLRLPLLLELADRSGLDLALPLERLGDDVRRHRLAELDVRAQRLSVRLVFPLVLCLLPAFVLLSMVPLAVGLLGDLPW